MKRLNWADFAMMLFLCMVGFAANKNVNSFTEWLACVVVFGLPISCVFLFMDKDGPNG